MYYITQALVRGDTSSSLFEYGLLKREVKDAQNSQAYIPHEDVHAMHSSWGAWLKTYMEMRQDLSLQLSLIHIC